MMLFKLIYFPNPKSDRNKEIICNFVYESERNIIFGGRLGEYKYYNMDEVIESSLNKFNSIIKMSLI